jgi:hypothetical protein
MNRAALIAQAELAHAVVGGILKALEEVEGLTKGEIDSPEWHLDDASSCLRQAQKELKRAATAAAVEIEKEAARASDAIPVRETMGADAPRRFVFGEAI